MPFLPTPGGVRIVLRHVQGPREWVNVMHSQTAPGPDAETLEFIAQTFYDAWAANIMPLMAPASVLVEAKAYSLDAVDAPIASVSPEVGTPGLSTGEPLPLQSAAVATLRTANRGRSGRGRIYIAGWPETASNQSELVPGFLSNLGAALDDFQADLASQLIPLCVLSQQIGGNKRTEGLLQVVTDIVVRNGVFGSQRRRNARD